MYRTLSGGVDLLQVEIESEVSPAMLEQAVAKYFESEESYLADLDEDKLEEHKQSVVDGLLESFKSSCEEGCYYWTQVEDGNYNFKECESACVVSF